MRRLGADTPDLETPDLEALDPSTIDTDSDVDSAAIIDASHTEQNQ